MGGFIERSLFMDRSEIYSTWLSTTYKSQDGYDTPLCNEKTIRKFNGVNDFNLRCYADYQEFYLRTRDVASIPSIRAKILQFLLSDGVRDIPLSDVTESILDDFFENRKQTAARQTFESIVSYLGGFFEFLQSERIVSNVFISEKYRSWALECQDSNSKAAQPMRARQVSEFRNYLLTEAVEHPVYREYLYVFDMLYYSDFENQQIKSLTVSDNVDVQSNLIRFGDNVCQVPIRVIENILALNETGRLGNLLNVRQYILNMRPLLEEEFDFENIRPKDIKETRKNCFIQCPQCGRRFEAVIENWCGMQYSETGEIWIVCKECGNG